MSRYGCIGSIWSPRDAGELNLHKLRFQNLLMWLTHLAEETFGIDDNAIAERMP